MRVACVGGGPGGLFFALLLARTSRHSVTVFDRDPTEATYGFGVVLFRILTGDLPFDLDQGVDLFSHQLYSPTPPPSWLIEDLDPGLEQIILRCTRKHPDNRYDSMQTVLDDLERVINGAPISALPLKRVPDLFRPRQAPGQEAAEALAAHFGTEPPPASSRHESDSPLDS